MICWIVKKICSEVSSYAYFIQIVFFSEMHKISITYQAELRSYSSDFSVEHSSSFERNATFCINEKLQGLKRSPGIWLHFAFVALKPLFFIALMDVKPCYYERDLAMIICILRKVSIYLLCWFHFFRDFDCVSRILLPLYSRLSESHSSE